MPNETGGLILIHYHDNKEVLDLLSALNGKLYYDGKVVFPIDDPDLLNKLADKQGVLQYDGKPIMIPLKNDKDNALQVTDARELFVDGKYFLTQKQYDLLTRFDFSAYLLTFDGQEVGLRASDARVENVIRQVFENIDNDVNYNWLKSSQEEENP